ncbi:4-alpha-glucanotransferase [Jannaschia seosinensis]|uniref:4-alpha-glucanotransferase n=1 Tax=Jannaschia seosinensis TaxID=313367 RepID=A0A0M7BB96_9RHOB|nr:4-alpha-glucanotransferase [Jannaschia seosinensis]CUH40010.1 4-alpha-glucanotransferase [Jannaschia seosinensis]
MKRLARHHGLTLEYDGREVPQETLRLILDGLGQDPDGPPTGPAAPKRMNVPKEARCYLPPSLRDAPGWGIFCQLYEIRSDRSWGIGDFADLAELARICGAAGADFLGINPVHALFTAIPEHASPFSPSSRRFLNPLYIAPDALGCARPAMADGDTVDYSDVARAKLTALRHAFDGFGDDPAFDAFVTEGGEALRLHALFEALSHAHGGGWHDWPEAFRDPATPEVAAFAEENAAEIRFHLWLQWTARRQLHEAQMAAKDAGMRIGLYLDLAVGEALDGSATWSGAAAALPGLTVGAPPDVFSEEGQNWQLAVPSPAALRETDFAPFRDMIAAQLRDAGALRIDHAMALWQLFLIPEGEPAAHGTHLRYPLPDMLRVLANASQKEEAVVIGEDLGFVPEGFRDAMEKARVLSYRIVYFEQSEDGFATADTYPEMALACLSTHDLPPLAGWWEGIDIDLREEHGLVSPKASKEHRKHREWERKHLARALGVTTTDPDPDTLLDAAHRFIAATPSLLAGVRLADLVGPARPTNLPGVTDAYPNWRPRSPTRLEDIATHPTFSRTTRIMSDARPRPE